MREIAVSRRDYRAIKNGAPLKTASILGYSRGDSLKLRCISTDAVADAVVLSVEYHKDSAGFRLVGHYKLGFDTEAHV